MPRLRLALLGPVGVSLDARSLLGELAGKPLALLVFLALERRQNFSREFITHLLWPNMDQGSARTNLRQALFKLRQTLGQDAGAAPFLNIVRDTVAFNTGSSCWVDADEFDALAPRCPNCRGAVRCQPCLARLGRSVALYRGELLADLRSIERVPAFEDWLNAKREHYRGLAGARLAQLSHGHDESGETAKALACARRRVDIQPWDEAAQRELITLLARDGQQALALAQWEICRRLLAGELGVEPAAATQALRASILCGALRPAPPPPVAASRRQLTVLQCLFDLPPGLDPETQADLAAQLRQRFLGAVGKRGGHALVLPVGGTAYFGYPAATETAATDAADAGLELAAWGMRVAVHSGVTLSTATEPDAAGQISALALRLAQAAHPAQVLASEGTGRLLKDRFHVQPAPPLAPGDAVRAILGRLPQCRAPQFGLTPMTGRDARLA